MESDLVGEKRDQNGDGLSGTLNCRGGDGWQLRLC